MNLGRIQWIIKIIFIVFVFNQFQRVCGIHCGKFGFSCINKRSYRKCDVYKKSYVDNFVNLCPIKTFCNEEAKRACSSTNGDKKDSSQDSEINDIISTQFSNKQKSTQMASTSYTSSSPTTAPTTTTTTTTTTPCADKNSSSSSVDNSKKLKKPPSPIKAEKNALGKHGKCKSNSTKHIKGKSKHSRDIWNFDNEPSSLFKEREQQYSPKNEIIPINSDSNSEKKDDAYNKNLRIRFTNTDINSAKFAKQFICPGVGSFPIKSDDSCFYVCFNRRRSAYNELKAIKVCCPKSMYFDKISHRCEKRNSKHSNWQRSRLRNRKFHRHETYKRNKLFK